MQKFTGSVLSKSSGEPLLGVTVQVNGYPGGALASLFSDADGVTPLGNPVTTDDTGYYEFYVANGRYTLTARDSEGNTFVVNDVLLHDSYARSGSFLWTPNSLVDGAGETSVGISVSGAAIGDRVDVVRPFDTQGVLVDAWVSAADTVKIRLQNETGGTVALASAVWGVRVTKQ